ncbi:epidermal growth factor receptor substrate 15-like 1 [Sceloporus undulatus]|uniref:epidermal growth factor receptor substrate 15-like 1 n=1 Tax=Sceloporus undulatus TaxID=8520 RepID=UPI001C4A8FB8|nr:epidermal growth factor receptor substrate 15-like 1 [Sceloporus undulatus]
MGKLNKDQFALAMHLIQQKVSKGIDPPQVLLPDMIPPAERTRPVQTLSGYLASVGTEVSALAEMRRVSKRSINTGMHPPHIHSHLQMAVYFC